MKKKKASMDPQSTNPCTHSCSYRLEVQVSGRNGIQGFYWFFSDVKIFKKSWFLNKYLFFLNAFLEKNGKKNYIFIFSVIKKNFFFSIFGTIEFFFNFLNLNFHCFYRFFLKIPLKIRWKIQKQFFFLKKCKFQHVSVIFSEFLENKKIKNWLFSR